MGKINQFHIVTGQAARLAHTPVQMEDLGANHHTELGDLPALAGSGGILV